MTNIIEEAKEFAQIEYGRHDPMHQWDHVEQVKEILDYLKDFYKDEIDAEILELALMFHDISYNSYETHVDDSAVIASKFLKMKGYPEDRISRIVEVIFDHSGAHRRVNGEAKTLEGKIMYDADKFHLALNPSGFEKYYDNFYLPETKELVKKRKAEQLC